MRKIGIGDDVLIIDSDLYCKSFGVVGVVVDVPKMLDEKFRVVRFVRGGFGMCKVVTVDKLVLV